MEAEASSKAWSYPGATPCWLEVKAVGQHTLQATASPGPNQVRTAPELVAGPISDVRKLGRTMG